MIIEAGAAPVSVSSLIPSLTSHVPTGAEEGVAVPSSLLEALAAVSDPRARRGVRHRFGTILGVAVCAVLAGARSYAAIAEWAADLPPAVRLRLGIGRRRPPSESAIRRCLQRVDPDQLDRVVSAWLAARAQATGPPGRRRVVAVDGKSARGARTGDDRPVHLLAAFDAATGVVLGQCTVDGKTNEVRREAPCRIPDSVRRNLEGDSWARWLTWTRKGMGTRACHEDWRSCPEAGMMRRGARVIWRRLDCLNLNLQ